MTQDIAKQGASVTDSEGQTKLKAELNELSGMAAGVWAGVLKPLLVVLGDLVVQLLGWLYGSAKETLDEVRSEREAKKKRQMQAFLNMPQDGGTRPGRLRR